MTIVGGKNILSYYALMFLLISCPDHTMKINTSNIKWQMIEKAE